MVKWSKVNDEWWTVDEEGWRVEEGSSELLETLV